jgi:hypothetical protein
MTADRWNTSHTLGMYLVQSNSVFINMHREDIVRSIKACIANGYVNSRHDKQLVTFYITHRHETNHFINAISSPWLVFHDEVCSYYMSSLLHALERHGPGTIYAPLADTKSKLREDVVERIERAEMAQMLQTMMLAEIPPFATVGDLIPILNGFIGEIAMSRGRSPEECATVITDLPPNSPISKSGWTVLNAMEALARLSEVSLLDKFGLDDQAFHKWFGPAFGTRADDLFALTSKPSNEVYKIYAKTYLSLVADLPSEVAAIALTLALRGRFFPFLGPGRIRLEDFHPVMLLERMRGDCETIYRTWRQRRPGFEEARLHWVSEKLNGNIIWGGEYAAHLTAMCDEVIKHLRGKYKLVDNPDDFARNRERLDSRFDIAFPIVAKSDQYQALKRELARLHTLRKRHLDEESGDLLGVIHAPVVQSDRYFALDHMFYSDDDMDFMNLFKRNGPLFAHDYRLATTAMGEYAVFGRKYALEAWAAIVKSLDLGFMGRNVVTDPMKRLYEVTGVECKF